MGSGTFPLSGGETDKLIEAKRLVKWVIDEYMDDVYSGDSGGMQYDNAASDGAHLEDLKIAIEMIDKCMRK